MRNTEWLKTHCRRLFLRGLSVNVWIGVHDFEKQAAQRVLLDIDLYVSLSETSPTRDSLDEVVDYDFVRETVHRRAAQGPIQLQETLCDDVLNSLLAHHAVLAARVRTAKPDVYPDCDAVGVEVFRIKSTEA